MKKLKYIGKAGIWSWKNYDFSQGDVKLVNDEDAEVLLKMGEFEVVGEIKEEKKTEDKPKKKRKKKK